MQSDGNCFGGDVVMDSLNMAYIDEDGILYLKSKEKQIFSNLDNEDFKSDLGNSSNWVFVLLLC